MCITYMDQYSVVSKRITWSIVLGFVAPWCFIVGWCELRQDFRLFRADCITHAEFLNDRYSRSRRQLVKEWRAQKALQRKHQTGGE